MTSSKQRIAAIEASLRDALNPEQLEIIDESEQHRGHGGWSEGGASHLAVHIVADVFQGRSRVQRSRMVHEILAKPLAESLHAVSLRLQTPEEIT